MKKEDKFERVDVYMMQSEILIIDQENLIIDYTSRAARN